MQRAPRSESRVYLRDVHIFPVLGRRRIGAVTAEDVQRFLADFRAKPKANGERRSETSVLGTYKAVARVMGYAYKHRLISFNPCVAVRKPKADTPELRAAGKFFTTGWNGFDAAVALSGGPYMIESSTRNDTTVLVRNEKWWANPAGPAKITVTAVTDSVRHPIKALAAQLRGPRTEGAMAPEIELSGQRPADYPWARHVAEAPGDEKTDVA